jgi:hypothetical protein
MRPLTPRLDSRIQQLPALGRRSATVLGHLGQDILQKPQLLKQEALVIAILIQVLLRTGIAIHSAKVEKDPTQKPIRTREAIRTALRELGGWVGNYFVLRAFQKATDAVLRKNLGITPDKSLPPVAFKKAAQDFKQVFSAWGHGQPLPTLTPSSIHDLEAYANPQFNPQSRLGRWFARNGQDPLPAMKRLYGTAPIAIGSMASLILAGFVLEWFTISQADRVSAMMARKVHPPDRSNGFSVFMADVQGEQTRRLF